MKYGTCLHTHLENKEVKSMKKLCVSLIVNGISFFVLDLLFDGILIQPGALITLMILFGILNCIVKPILKILSFPLTFMTFGLFSFVINGMVLYWAFSFVNGAYCSSLFTGILASIVLSILNSGFNTILGND